MSTAPRSQARNSKDDGASRDLTLLAALLGIVYLSGPVLATVRDGMDSIAFLAAAPFAVLVTLTRLQSVLRIAVWTTAFVALYAISALTVPGGTAGFNHTSAALSAGAAILLFASYGKSMVESQTFRIAAYAVIVAGIVGTWAGGGPKNGMGGAILYLVAMLLSIMVARARTHYWPYVLAFFVLAGALGFILDFRGLIGYAAVLVLAYLGAATLPKRLFWLVGIVGSSIVVGVTMWYFINIATSALADTITRLVSDASGRRAASGRDWLWPAILETVGSRDPWFGLGAGMLPRDFMPTDLSSHSYYIQVYLQLGFVGLTVLVGLLLSVWKPLAFSTDAPGYFGAAIFLMFVTHNATEVLMFQNALLVGIPAWCAIGLAISVTKKSTALPMRPQTEAATGLRGRR